MREKNGASKVFFWNFEPMMWGASEFEELLNNLEWSNIVS